MVDNSADILHKQPFVEIKVESFDKLKPLSIYATTDASIGQQMIREWSGKRHPINGIFYKMPDQKSLYAMGTTRFHLDISAAVGKMRLTGLTETSRFEIIPEFGSLSVKGENLEETKSTIELLKPILVEAYPKMRLTFEENGKPVEKGLLSEYPL